MLVIVVAFISQFCWLNHKPINEFQWKVTVFALPQWSQKSPPQQVSAHAAAAASAAAASAAAAVAALAAAFNSAVVSHS